jgi:hypothetical protein
VRSGGVRSELRGSSVAHVAVAAFAKAPGAARSPATPLAVRSGIRIPLRVVRKKV